MPIENYFDTLFYGLLFIDRVIRDANITLAGDVIGLGDIINGFLLGITLKIILGTATDDETAYFYDR